MMQYSAGSHQVKSSRWHRPGQNVRPADIKPGGADVRQRQVQVYRDRAPAGRDLLGKPGGHRAIAAADLERPRSLLDAEFVKVAAVHRIQQP